MLFTEPYLGWGGSGLVWIGWIGWIHTVLFLACQVSFYSNAVLTEIREAFLSVYVGFWGFFFLSPLCLLQL